MTHRFSFFSLSVLFFLTGSSFFLFSQETISIDVTAEKIADEVPLHSSTSTVISADEIAESGASNIVEILEKVPGIVFRSPLAGPGSEQITMRGFGENSHGRVLILVDGNRLNNPDMKGINWNAVSLLDIERIEILDGAASVRYGNYAVAGVINIITKKSGKTQTSINLSAGSFWNNAEGISHQQSTGWGRFSFAAEHFGTEAYRDRSASNVTNASLQGTIDFTDRLSLTLNGSFADLKYQMPGAIFESDYKNDPQTALNWNDEAAEHHVSGGAELEWFLSDNIELNLPLLYRGMFAKIDMVGSGSFPWYNNRNINSAEAHPAATFNFDINEMPLEILFGMDFYYAKLLTKDYTTIQREKKKTELSIDNFDSGYFITTRFNPFEKLSLNAGIRYNNVMINAEHKNTFHQSFVYEAGAAFRPISSLNIYTKYATLFRYPFVDEWVQKYEDFMTSQIVVDFNNDLNPEKGFNLEGGINFSFAKWLSLDANVYYLHLVDEIFYDNTISKNINLDETRRIGTNISVSSNPFQFLELQGSYSFVNAQFTSGANNGNDFSMVPAHEFSGIVTFVLPLNVRLGVNVDYRGSAYQSGDNSNALPKVDDYILYGASISYILKNDDYRLRILLEGKNLLNTTYSSYVTYSMYNPETGSAYYPGNGREFNLSLQYQF
jgi:iron complex outermembrane receptor protein